MKSLLLALLALLLAGCATLPGHQGGPMPRSTQYTYPGRAVHPETGVLHSPVPTVAEPTDGGLFVFGLVFATGATAPSLDRWESFADCERERAAYAATLAQRGDRIMTVRCYRVQEAETATQTR